MSNVFKGTKQFFGSLLDERANKRIYHEKNLILTDLRICTSQKENEYITSHVVNDEKKMYFLSRRIIECNSILVDAFGNLFRIVSASHEQNKFLDGRVTLVCSYEFFVPQNEFRKNVNQIAYISQTISGLNFQNVENVHLDINQVGKIEQNISLPQLIDSAEEEMKYRFKPISNRESFIMIINEIVSGKRTIEDLKDKVVQGTLKQTSGLLKSLLDLLIKKLKNIGNK